MTLNPLSLGIFGQLSAVRDKQDARAQQAQQEAQRLEDRVAARTLQQKTGAHLDAESWALTHPAEKPSDDQIVWDDDGQGNRKAYKWNKTANRLEPLNVPGEAGPSVDSWLNPEKQKAALAKFGGGAPRTLDTSVSQQGSPAPQSFEQRVNQPTKPAPRQLTQTKPAKPITWSLVETGDGTMKPVDPATGLGPDGKPVQKRIAPVPTEMTSVKHENGTTTLEPKTPHMVTDEGQANSKGLGSLSPAALASMADQARTAHKVMTDLETKFKNKQWAPSPGSQALGSGSGAHATSGLGSLISGAVAEGSNRALGTTDPQYQTYLAAQRRFGNIMGNLMSKRYTEYQGTLDTQLAGLSGGDVDSTLGLKQAYRQDLLDNLAKLGAVKQGGGGPVSEASWATNNPAKRGETFEQYHARYLAASGGH